MMAGLRHGYRIAEKVVEEFWGTLIQFNGSE